VALVDGLNVNITVRQLLIQNNDLKAAGAQAFGKMLKENKTLHHLDLSDNGIGNDQVKVNLHQVLCLVTCRDREEFNHCILDFSHKQHAFANQKKYLSHVRKESEIVEDAITKRKLRIQDQVQAINLSHSGGSASWSKVQDVKQIASAVANDFNRECHRVTSIQPALIRAKAGKTKHRAFVYLLCSSTFTDHLNLTTNCLAIICSEFPSFYVLIQELARHGLSNSSYTRSLVQKRMLQAARSFRLRYILRQWLV
jgi:hypothetical protein